MQERGAFMNRAVNDATLQKVGDIYQYYIALLDCFKMEPNDKIQIEINGDVSKITDLNKNSFQKEVKHHFGNKNLADREEDFWKTLSNWYIEYERIKDFSDLILCTTSSISADSVFYNWNEKEAEEKINILLEIGKTNKKREETFRSYYNKIFDQKVYEREKIINILRKFTIESSQSQIGEIIKKFEPYIGYIPDPNKKAYVEALLGRIVSRVADPPHRWEITRKEFDLIIQQEVPAYMNPREKPLPTEFADTEISENSVRPLLEKNFVKEIKRIEYEKQIQKAVLDYWKAQKTVIKYFQEDFSYLKSLQHYKTDLLERLKYIKDEKKIETEGMDRVAQIRSSKVMYTNVMSWEAKDFESIISNRGYFQRGIIHTIVDDKKFNWDVGDNDEC